MSLPRICAVLSLVGLLLGGLPRQYPLDDSSEVEMKFVLLLYGRIQNGMVVWKWAVGYSGAGAWRTLKHGRGSWLLIPSPLASWLAAAAAHSLKDCILTAHFCPPSQQPLPALRPSCPDRNMAPTSIHAWERSIS